MPLSQDDQKKYKALYLQTARQYVKELQDNLTLVNTGKEAEESLASLHRAAHSLGSQSTMMGYVQMSTASSHLEKIFLAAKEKRKELTHEILPLLIKAANEMEACMEIIDQDSKESDLSQTIQELQTLVDTAA